MNPFRGLVDDDHGHEEYSPLLNYYAQLAAAWSAMGLAGTPDRGSLDQLGFGGNDVGSVGAGYRGYSAPDHGGYNNDDNNNNNNNNNNNMYTTQPIDYRQHALTAAALQFPNTHADQGSVQAYAYPTAIPPDINSNDNVFHGRPGDAQVAPARDAPAQGMLWTNDFIWSLYPAHNMGATPPSVASAASGLDTPITNPWAGAYHPAPEDASVYSYDTVSEQSRPHPAVPETRHEDRFHAATREPKPVASPEAGPADPADPAVTFAGIGFGFSDSAVQSASAGAPPDPPVPPEPSHTSSTRGRRRNKLNEETRLHANESRKQKDGCQSCAEDRKACEHDQGPDKDCRRCRNEEGKLRTGPRPCVPEWMHPQLWEGPVFAPSTIRPEPYSASFPGPSVFLDPAIALPPTIGLEDFRQYLARWKHSELRIQSREDEKRVLKVDVDAFVVWLGEISQHFGGNVISLYGLADRESLLRTLREGWSGCVISERLEPKDVLAAWLELDQASYTIGRRADGVSSVDLEFPVLNETGLITAGQISFILARGIELSAVHQLQASLPKTSQDIAGIRRIYPILDLLETLIEGLYQRSRRERADGVPAHASRLEMTAKILYFHHGRIRYRWEKKHKASATPVLPTFLPRSGGPHKRPTPEAFQEFWEKEDLYH